MKSFGPVSCSLDLERDGFRSGNIRLDFSSNEHAAALIPIPIQVLKNGDGPTVMLSAGVHGDEYEGQIALRSLAHRIPLDQVRGRIILLPAFNAPAVRAAARVSPLDGGNMNRCFPGATDQGPTRAIAGFVMEHLAPLCDFALDLHSGGTTGIYEDIGYLTLAPDAALRARCIEAAEWLGAPMTLAAAMGDTAGDYDQAMLRRGTSFLSAEFGGGGVLGLESLAVARRGLRNILHWTGVWRHEGPAKAPGTIYVTSIAGGHVLAPRAGLFEPAFDVGAAVEAGQVAGWLYDLDEHDRPPRPLVFEASGRIFMRRAPVLCHAGSILATVARPIGKDEALAL